MQQLNAIDLLKKITQQRNWHNIKEDKQLQRKAATDKNLLKKGKLSYQKACYWLRKLGYQKIEEEVWSK